MKIFKGNLLVMWILFVIVGVGLMIYRSRFELAIGDELLSLLYAGSYDFTTLLQQPIDVSHPNTYYMLVKQLTRWGADLEALRYISVGIYIAGLLFTALLGKLYRFDHEQTSMLVAFMAFWGYWQRFGFQVRMYGILMTLVVLSLFLFVNVVRGCTWRRWLAMVLVDMLGLLVGFGFGYVLLVKAVTWILIRHNIVQSSGRGVWLYCLVVFAVIMAGMSYAGVNREVLLSHSFLYWRGVTGFYTGGLQLLGLLGLGGYEVLEGLRESGYLDEAIGNLATISLWCGVVGMWVKREWIHTKLQNRGKDAVVWYWLVLVSMLLLGLGHVVDWMTGLPIMHIRQLAGVSIIWGLGLGLFIASGIRTSPVYYRLAGVLVLSLLCFMQVRMVGIQLYPHAYSNSPDGLLLLDRHDVELAYFRCGAKTYQDMIATCPLHGAILVQSAAEFEKLAASIPGEFWVSGVLYHSLVKEYGDIVCSEQDIRYYRCWSGGTKDTADETI